MDLMRGQRFGTLMNTIDYFHFVYCLLEYIVVRSLRFTRL